MSGAELYLDAAQLELLGEALELYLERIGPDAPERTEAEALRADVVEQAAALRRLDGGAR